MQQAQHSHHIALNMQVTHAAAAPGILHLQRCEQVGARSAHSSASPDLGLLPLRWPVDLLLCCVCLAALCNGLFLPCPRFAGTQAIQSSR